MTTNEESAHKTCYVETRHDNDDVMRIIPTTNLWSCL